MTTPTPEQLATSLLDVALGYEAEVVGLGQPDPTLGHHIKTMAHRLLHRVPAADPRLTAFTLHTDPTGYVWLGEALHAYLKQAADTNWSFERWFTGLAEVARQSPGPDSSDLAALAETGGEVDRLSVDGFRPTSAVIGPDGGGFVLKRPANRP